MLENKENCPHLEMGWCPYCVDLWKEAYNKGKKDGLARKIGYMCRTDYEYELGEAVGGCEVYPTIEDLKNHRKCWSDCGIVKVEIILRGEE